MQRLASRPVCRQPPAMDGFFVMPRKGKAAASHAGAYLNSTDADQEWLNTLDIVNECTFWWLLKGSNTAVQNVAEKSQTRLPCRLAIGNLSHAVLAIFHMPSWRSSHAVLAISHMPSRPAWSCLQQLAEGARPPAASPKRQHQHRLHHGNTSEAHHQFRPLALHRWSMCVRSLACWRVHFEAC